jgi:hypothetical protein
VRGREEGLPSWFEDGLVAEARDVQKIVVWALSMQKRNNEMTKEESSPQPEAVSRLALYVCCTSHGTEMVQSVHLPSGKLARVRIVMRDKV